MLIPHFYILAVTAKKLFHYTKKAFNVKADSVIFNSDYAPDEYKEDDDRIAHAGMHISMVKRFFSRPFWQEGYFDRYCTSSYCHVLKAKLNYFLTKGHNERRKMLLIDPLETLPYSPLAVQFIDRFGVQWGFMVEENAV